MLLRVVLIACVLAALVAGCGGGDDSDDAGLAPSSFEEVVVAELKKAGIEAEPSFDLNVSAFRGPNRVDVDLEDDYAHYEEDPDRESEIVAGVVEEAERRLDEGVADLSLEDVRDDLMPLLKSPFELRTYDFEPAETAFPGGLAAVYAVDREGDFTLVEPEDVERWGTTVEELHELALLNLLRQTNEEEPLLCEPSGNQKLCGWSSSDGYDATRMIVPELRRQIVREYGGPAVYAVPMENVFVALPEELVSRGKTEELFRRKVDRDFQTSKDPLSPEVFVERDGELALFR